MAIKDYRELNNIQLDVLREIGNIGTGNAATSLSSMLQKSVNISVPTINILEYQQVTDLLGGPENMIVGILFTLSGDVKGMMMFLLEQEFTHTVLNALLGQELTDFSQIDEMSMSALQEIGNIMAASYVNAIAQLTSLTIDISVPSTCIDMAGAILSVPAICFGNISDHIILIQDSFNSDSDNLVSHILLIPEVDSLDKIMTHLGVS
ncbi:MAG: chemotaxis protein CheC [Oscillospiraceae bacterium]|nr:chemotaxis protein CheC [Oscillospiraceae bacterium]